MRKLKFSLLVLGLILSSLQSFSQTTVSCNGYNQWVATQPYTSNTVYLNGVLYQSRWYNVSTDPSTHNTTADQPWTVIGNCAQPIIPGTVSCANISAWSSSTIYNGGAQVTYNGFRYTAAFWTQGDQPDVNNNYPWRLDASCQSPASLSVTGTLSNFTAYVGSLSTAQSITITGTNLSNNTVTITAPANFEISLNQTTGFTSSLQLIPASGSISATIYVVYSPAGLGTDHGNIVITSTGVTTQNIAVTGTAQAIWLAAADYIYNANTGNVAIGPYTLPLTARLNVNGTVKSTGIQLTTNPGDGKVLTSDVDGNGTWKAADFSNGWKLAGNNNTDLTSFLGTTVAQPVIFKTNNVEAMRIASDGTIGIGYSSSPLPAKLSVNGNTYVNGKLSIGDSPYFNTDFALSVKGKIIAERVTVLLNTTWPDYAFAPDYKLMSLGQVEKYIQQHKHLPGIPSEAEVKEKGIELGDMNVLLLEKVEELTLHAIEHEKTIEAQTAQIANQQKLNEKLLQLLEKQNSRIEKLENK
jgi:hypothetical protein